MPVRCLVLSVLLAVFLPATTVASVGGALTTQWAPTAPAAAERWRHTMTPLLDGRILVTGGEDATGTLASAEVYDPRADRWSSVGALSHPRQRHMAVVLHDGRVLIAGGSDGSVPVPTAELFDPTTGTFSAAPDMSEPRHWGTLTRLRDGTVLAIGGENGSGYATTVDLFDPADDSWKSRAPLPLGHARHVALRLPGDDVLVSGGYDDTSGLSGATHIYRSDTDRWEDIGSLASPRYKHTALVRPDGSVIVAAGYGATGYLSSTELLPAGATAFIAGPALARSRGYHTSVGLPDGSLILLGGDGLSSAEQVRPDGTVVDLPGMPTARTWAAATLLADGQVMVTGGSGTAGDARAITLAHTELRDKGLLLPDARAGHTLTTLADRSVLLVGGTAGAPATGASDVLRWTDTDGWQGAEAIPGPLAGALEGHTASLMPDSSVLIVGGRVGGAPALEVWEWVFGPDCWWGLAELPSPRAEHAAIVLADGRLLVTGGTDGSTHLAETLIYERSSNSWTAVDPLPAALRGLRLTRLDDGRVLAVGGIDGSGRGSTLALVFEPAAGSWTPTGPLASPRVGHALVPLIGGRVLATGNDELDGLTDTPDEIWDPLLDTWTATAALAQRYGGSLAPLPDGGALLVGGGVTEVEWVNPRDGRRYPSGLRTDGRSRLAATSDGGGGALVVGGEVASVPYNDGWQYRAGPPASSGESPLPSPQLALLPPGAEPGARIGLEIPNLSAFPEGGSGMMNSGAVDAPQVLLQAWEGGPPRVQTTTFFGDPVVQVEVEASGGSGWHHLSAIVSGQASEPETFRVADADRRIFLGPDLSVEAGACSDALDVAASDASGTPLVVASAKGLTFGSDGASLSFHGDATCSSGPPADIDAGRLRLPVRVMDRVAGQKTIWVGAPGAPTAMQDRRQVNITPADADHLRILADDGTARTCETETLTVRLEDRFDNTLAAGAEGEAVQLSVSPAGSVTFASSNLVGGLNTGPETLLGTLGASGEGLIEITSDQVGPITVTATYMGNPLTSESVVVDFTQGGPGCRSDGPIGVTLAGGVQRAVAGQRIPFSVKLSNDGSDPVTEVSLSFACEGLRVLELADHALRTGESRYLGDLEVGADSSPSGRALVEVGADRATCRARATYQVGGVFLQSESAPWIVEVRRTSGDGIACASGGRQSPVGLALGLGLLLGALGLRRRQR